MTRRAHQSGLTLIEVLVAITLLAIVIVPATRALHTSVVGTNVHSDVTTVHYRLTSQVEQLLVEPFESLENAAVAAGSASVATTYSETAGNPGRLLVFLAYYDGDNADGDDDGFTGVDTDVLWIRVESEGTVHGIETLATRGT